MTFYTVMRDGHIYDITISFDNAVGSFRAAYHNRKHPSGDPRFSWDEIINIECWESTPPKPARCVWRYRADWSRGYTMQEIEELSIKDLVEDIRTHRRVFEIKE